MVPEQTPQFREAGVHLAAGGPDPDRAVVVLQITVRGERAQIHPPSQIGVAEETVVRLVRVPEHDRVLDFAVDLRDRPDRHGGVRPAEQGRAAPGEDRPLQPRERAHRDAFLDPDGTGGDVEHDARFDQGAFPHTQPLDPAADRVNARRQARSRRSAAQPRRAGEVGCDLGRVPGDEVPHVHEHPAGQVVALLRGARDERGAA